MTRRTFVKAATAAPLLSALSASRVLGANDRIGVGILGCGRRNLLGEVLEHREESNAEVRAVCDIWRPMREAASAEVEKETGSKPAEIHSYHDLLARDDIDAVIIGTPDHQHSTQLIDAVRAGKDVYVEKPLSMDISELHSAYRAVKASDRVVQMGTQVRSFSSAVAAREFVRSGGLGQVFKIEQSRNSYRPYWSRYAERPVEERDTDWKAFLMHREARPWDPQQYAGWYGYREFSRGPQSNLAVHFFDLVHFIMDSGPPERVTAMGGSYRWNKQGFTVPDSVEIALEYPEKGFLVSYSTTFGVNGNRFLKFFGTRGEMDGTRWGDPFQITGKTVEDADRIADSAVIPEIENPPHMLNFLDCLRTRKTPAASIEAGYAHAIAVIMADESLVRGRRVVYDAERREIRDDA